MHFCPKCGNMYYLRLKKDNKDNEDGEDALIYYCRNCGNEDASLVSNLNNLYVSRTDIKTSINYKNIINKYTKLDPTLPRIKNIDCPNKECESNQIIESKDGNTIKSEKEIIYIRYDDKKYEIHLFMCRMRYDLEY